MRLPHCLPFGLLALTLGAAHAASVATLSGRSSVDYLYYFGGFAISGDEGEAGAPPPVPGGPWEGAVLTDLEPRALALAGSDYALIHYLGWNGYLAETWDQSQAYGLGNGEHGAVLTASGSSAVSQTSEVCSPTGCFAATELHRSTNTQKLEFTLSGSSAYTLAGVTAGGQWVDLLAYDPAHDSWNTIVYGAFYTNNGNFSLAGQLAAGRYQVRNNPYTFQGGGKVDVNNRWQYTLTLADAVAAVPEPAPAWLWLAGLGLLARKSWRRDS